MEEIAPGMLQNVFCNTKAKFEIFRDTDRTHVENFQ